jgi:hypothetical protein
MASLLFILSPNLLPITSVVNGFRTNLPDPPSRADLDILLLHPAAPVARLDNLGHGVRVVGALFPAGVAGQLVPLDQDLGLGHRLEVGDAQQVLRRQRLDAQVLRAHPQVHELVRRVRDAAPFLVHLGVVHHHLVRRQRCADARLVL